MDIHDATRIITSTLQSQRRTPAFKEGYLDGLTGCSYFGGYTDNRRIQYTNGWEKGKSDSEAWQDRKRGETSWVNGV